MAPPALPPTPQATQYVLNPYDRSILLDHNQIPITVDRLLHTKPLQSELLSRPGPNNRRLTYLSGEAVTRTLNEIFGYHGWNLSILSFDRVEARQDTKTSKWHIAYHAHVRITLVPSGAFREDVGNGDAVDKVWSTAAQHALKSSVTDAMKRAARHFGDRLGNSLYESNFNINKAPKTQLESLREYEQRFKRKYGGFDGRGASGGDGGGSGTGGTAPAAASVNSRTLRHDDGDDDDDASVAMSSHTMTMSYPETPGARQSVATTATHASTGPAVVLPPPSVTNQHCQQHPSRQVPPLATMNIFANSTATLAPASLSSLTHLQRPVNSSSSSNNNNNNNATATSSSSLYPTPTPAAASWLVAKQQQQQQQQQQHNPPIAPSKTDSSVNSENPVERPKTASGRSPAGSSVEHPIKSHQNGNSHANSSISGGGNSIQNTYQTNASHAPQQQNQNCHPNHVNNNKNNYPCSNTGPSVGNSNHVVKHPMLPHTNHLPANQNPALSTSNNNSIVPNIYATHAATGINTNKTSIPMVNHYNKRQVIPTEAAVLAAPTASSSFLGSSHPGPVTAAPPPSSARANPYRPTSWSS